MKKIKIIFLFAIVFLVLPNFSKAATEPIKFGENFTMTSYRSLIVSEGVYYFSANDGVHGAELWKTDGTANGTVLVKDINPGTGSSNVNFFTELNGELFFSADNGVNGSELWKTDGTASGTVMVKDVLAGSESSWVENLVVYKNKIYFQASDGIAGNNLWQSDGTTEGTVMLMDNFSGVAGAMMSVSITTAGNYLYFFAVDIDGNTNLWKSDGTKNGTVLVKDFGSLGGYIYSNKVQEFNGSIYFSASSTLGNGLYKSDGTEAGTVFVKNYASSYSDLHVLLGNMYYSRSDRYLVKSDGTAAGTVILKDFGIANFYGSYFKPTVFNNSIYFQAKNAANGYELWKTDGTASGTVMLKDIKAGISDSDLSQKLIVFNNELYFTADDGTHGYELWKTDGTASGTVLVKDINIGSGNSFGGSFSSNRGTILYKNSNFDGVILNKALVFFANDGAGDAFWEIDPEDPSVPSSFSSSHQTTTSISLAWSAATDNIAVTSYNIYKNASLLTNTTNITDRTFTDSNLAPATSYSYTVSALDLAGNESAQSSPLSVSTLTLPTDPILVIETPTPEKPHIDSYQIYQADPTKNCSKNIKIEIQGKNFTNDSKVEIGDKEANDTNKKDAKNITASFCLTKLINNKTTNLKKELSITNPDSDRETADKKIDLNSISYKFKTKDLNTNTKEGIRNIQTLLYQKGYLSNMLYITGNYGDITKEAVRKFQKDKGLLVTGIVGEETRRKLGK